MGGLRPAQRDESVASAISAGRWPQGDHRLLFAGFVRRLAGGARLELPRNVHREGKAQRHLAANAGLPGDDSRGVREPTSGSSHIGPQRVNSSGGQAPPGLRPLRRPSQPVTAEDIGVRGRLTVAPDGPAVLRDALPQAVVGRTCRVPRAAPPRSSISPRSHRRRRGRRPSRTCSARGRSPCRCLAQDVLGIRLPVVVGTQYSPVHGTITLSSPLIRAPEPSSRLTIFLSSPRMTAPRSFAFPCVAVPSSGRALRRRADDCCHREAEHETPRIRPFPFLLSACPSPSPRARLQCLRSTQDGREDTFLLPTFCHSPRPWGLFWTDGGNPFGAQTSMTCACRHVRQVLTSYVRSRRLLRRESKQGDADRVRASRRQGQRGLLRRLGCFLPSVLHGTPIPGQPSSRLTHEQKVARREKRGRGSYASTPGFGPPGRRATLDRGSSFRSAAHNVTTHEKGLVETFVDVIPSCDEDRPALHDHDHQQPRHARDHLRRRPRPRDVHPDGQFVAVPLEDPSLPSFTGHFTQWGGFNQNGTTVNGTFTFSLRGTGSDGSTFSIHPSTTSTNGPTAR